MRQEKYHNERGTITAAEQWVKELLKVSPQAETTDHGWHHIDLVRRTALAIARQEEADGREAGNQFLTELIVIFHELVDSKIKIFSDATRAQEGMKTWMLEQSMSSGDIEKVLAAVTRMPYSVSGFTQEIPDTPEARIAQDADRLAALGASGVARAFVWSPLLDKPIFDIEKPPRSSITRQNYRSEMASTFNFIFEAVFDRALRLNTSTARTMAGPRVLFMISFIRQYLSEQLDMDVQPFQTALDEKIIQLRTAGIIDS